MIGYAKCQYLLFHTSCFLRGLSSTRVIPTAKLAKKAGADKHFFKKGEGRPEDAVRRNCIAVKRIDSLSFPFPFSM